jgi:MFS transporter, DHA1 family, multidrug resistance protein
MPLVLAKFDRVKVVVLSTIFAISGLALAFLASMMIPDHPLLITCLMWIYVSGIVIPPTMMFVQAMDMFPALRASASSLIQALRMLSMSLGTAIAGAFYDGSYRPVGLVMLIFMIMAIPLIWLVMRKQTSPAQSSDVVLAMH